MTTQESHAIENLTQFAMEVIQESGKEALNFYGKGRPDMKFDEELVTKTELHLTEFFDTRLHQHFPEHQIFMNNHDIESYTHDDKRYLWIYDPLDGVANFQAGIPIWGISLSLIENFWPVLGLFYMPATGDLFHAQAGQKAYRGEQEIRISPQESIDDESLCLIYSRFHQHYHSTFPGKIRNLGCTAAHICYVAMGRAEAAVVANVSYQDLAAARVIVESAGGKIYKMDGNEFFLNEYLGGESIEEHLLIAPPGAYPQTRACLEEIY
ncbi:inositol monophosphatase family protein [Thermodesulfobacteriota bacterium]